MGDLGACDGHLFSTFEEFTKGFVYVSKRVFFFLSLYPLGITMVLLQFFLASPGRLGIFMPRPQSNSTGNRYITGNVMKCATHSCHLIREATEALRQAYRLDECSYVTCHAAK